MTKSRKLTKSRRCTNKSKSRSGKRKSKKPRVSRRAHCLRGGSQVKAINEENRNTIHNQHSTHQHKTSPTVDKESKWTKTGRALMYGVGAAGTGALAGIVTGVALTPNQYTEDDLNKGLDDEWNQQIEHQRGKTVLPQQLQQQKQIFLMLKNIAHYTENNKKQIKQNAVIGAGLAAAAAGTYGATRHKKDAKATKPGKLTRAGRALMYGVGAVGTGAAIGAATGYDATALQTRPYTEADLNTGGLLVDTWNVFLSRVKPTDIDRAKRAFLSTMNKAQQNKPPNITKNMGRNVMIGAGLAAVAAGTYGATRD